MKKYDIALFDLDGTVSESAFGIKLCIEKTLTDMKKPCPDLSDCSKFIGPPLVHTFRDLCKLSEEEAQTAVEIYVKHYDVIGVRENRLYKGMKETLTALKNNAVRLCICSSKHEVVAKSVVKMLGVSELFEAVCGSTVDGTRKEKEELIPYALKKLNADAGDRVVMIGDTKFDAKGAFSCKVDFIGAVYGYGTKDSMIAFGADKFARTPNDILSFIL